MKKKLGALIGLATCVTIGGVYATWAYAGTNDIADVSTNIQFNIPSATLKGTFGEYKVTSNVSITIDESATGTYKTALYYSNGTKTLDLSEGSADRNETAITITLTLNDYADYDIRAEGVKTYFYFAMGDTTTKFAKMDATGNYIKGDTTTTTLTDADQIDIFTFTKNVDSKAEINVYNEASGAGTAAAGTWSAPVDNVFTYTITFGELSEMISIGDFILDTKVEHDAFSAVLNTAKMNFHVTDGIVS